MIPQSLEPLLSRLKNPIQDDDDSLEAILRRNIAPVVIKLIEGQGIGSKLVFKFKKDGKLNQELLEEFVLRAAMCIDTPSKTERKPEWEEYINTKFEEIFKRFEKIYFELVDINKMCIYNEPAICKGAKPGKEMGKVWEVWMEVIPKLKQKYLSKLNPPKKPNNINMLINLFREYLPKVEKTFMDEQIIKMLKPFGIELKKRSVSAIERRSEKEGDWYLLKVRREEKPQ
jgi:hypothetical protein